MLFQGIYFLLLFFSMNCHAGEAISSTKGSLSKEYVLLGLVGYNYTDRNISEYSVDGASGGHVDLSSPASGGSGVTCCVKILKKNLEPMQVKVRWQVDGCLQFESNPRTGAKAERRVLYYKEAEVGVESMVREKPKYIETHFYPDGTVRVKLTGHTSKPLLALNEKRLERSFFPRCENGD